MTTAYEVWERRVTAPTLVFDLVDLFLRERRTAGPRPRVRGRVRYRVVATEAGGVRTSLDAPLDMVMTRNTSGYDLWFGEVTRDGETARRYRPLLPPALVVEIDADRYQRVETLVTALPVPDPPRRLALLPGATYEFPTTTTLPGGTGPTLLRGTLRRPDGTGIPGARVRVDPRPVGQPLPEPVCVTAGSGDWVLAFDDAVATMPATRVQITPASGPVTLVTEVRITRGDTEALRQASLAGATVRASGAPLPGVVVTADRTPGISTTSDTDGRWELWLPIEQFLPSGGLQAVNVTATPPQGAPQIAAGQIQPRATARIAPLVFA